MKKCILIINKISGNSGRVTHDERLINELKGLYESVDTLYIEDAENRLDICAAAKDYDAVAVCGGDGTFNSAINALKDDPRELIYVPCGTLNDTAKALKLAEELRGERKIRRVDIGEIGDTLFSYVAAAGIFTAIGYKTKNSTKKKIKLLAYLFEVLREYKVHRIAAEIKTNEETLSGEFTLIMAINSSRCFGFNFNKLYSHNSGTGHLLTIRAPKAKGFFGKIEVFFPLFRTFFIGFKKPYEGKVLRFTEFSEADILLKSPIDFTVDGEKLPLCGENRVRILKQKIKLYIM